MLTSISLHNIGNNFVICIHGVCQQYENGVLLYRDTDHLAYEGAKRAAKPLLDFWTSTLKKKAH
jgi:hypothetical protein